MSMSLRIITARGAAVLLAVTCCAAAEPSVAPSDTFGVVIRDFYGAEGYTYVYDLGPAGLTVSLENDFGRPTRELCNVPLPEDQRAGWVRFLSTFPLEKLESEYINPAVDDGLQMTFSVKRGQAEARTIQVANMGQADLARLCDRVAALVPSGCVRRPLRLPAD